MGVSTNAILFYGIDIGEEVPDWDEDALDEWEVTYASRLGIKEPEVPYNDNEEVHKKYWDNKSKLAKASGCKVGQYCCSEYPMRYVALKETETTVYRGEAVEIKSLTVPVDANDKLRRFCKVMGIEYQDPKWFLTSYWG